VWKNGLPLLNSTTIGSMELLAVVSPLMALLHRQMVAEHDEGEQ
jgi:hypothetical protein